MLKVNVFRDEKNNIYSYRAFGHCGFDELGKDVVCAAASTLLQVSILGLNHYSSIEPEVKIAERLLECTISKNIYVNRDIQAILETMVVGLKEIEKNYSKNIEVVEIKGIKQIIEKGVNSNMQESNSSEKMKNCLEEECDFSVRTMLGVALLGAAASATFYYIYTQLSVETKKSMKDMVVGTMRSKLESITSPE